MVEFLVFALYIIPGLACFVKLMGNGIPGFVLAFIVSPIPIVNLIVALKS